MQQQDEGGKRRRGVLHGLKVIELAGLAPVPFCGMMLSDFGAEVVRVERMGALPPVPDTLSRGKRSLALQLKSKAGVELLMRLLERADVFLDPYRPGVLERLGLGPEVVLKRNPRLIFARLTGYGQTGPYAHKAGHDINYVALSGALSLFGRSNEKPLPPGNLLADFAGGGQQCMVGILLALLERERTGRGQVVDASMVNGVSYLSTFVHKARTAGFWADDRGHNMLDSGAHFYETYKTKDGKYVAVGAIEPQFYQQLVKGLGLKIEDLPPQMDQQSWTAMKQRFQDIFLSKTRQEWDDIFNSADSPFSDACVSPVLRLDELMDHPHNKATGLLQSDCFQEMEPRPAPILSATPAMSNDRPRPSPGEHSAQVLMEYLDLSSSEVSVLQEKGIVGGSSPHSPKARL
ncbi:Alpha-methylacyl-CoA racemase [Balamuthia mandrillaris]